jgi:hypothetical protein
VVGEGVHVIGVLDPATIAAATSIHLPPIERTPEVRRADAAQPKKYSPATTTDQGNMQASEIKAVLDSHGVRLPRGWETRLSRAGEMYYYDTVNQVSSWKDPCVTKLSSSIEPRSNPALLPQIISGPQVPPSRPRPLETTKSYPTQLPKGWVAEPTVFNEGRIDGW